MSEFIFPGFCQRRNQTVIDGDCLNCFCGFGKGAWKQSERPANRMACVEMHIVAPVALEVHDPIRSTAVIQGTQTNTEQFMAMVDTLTRDDMRAVFANLAMLIDQSQDNPVAGSVWNQVQSHAAYRRNDQ